MDEKLEKFVETDYHYKLIEKHFELTYKEGRKNYLTLFYDKYFVYYDDHKIHFRDLELNKEAYTYDFDKCYSFEELADNKLVFVNCEDNLLYILEFKEQKITMVYLEQNDVELRIFKGIVCVDENIVIGYNGMFYHINIKERKKESWFHEDPEHLFSAYFFSFGKINDDFLCLSSNFPKQKFIIDWRNKQVVTVIKDIYYLINTLNGRIARDADYFSDENVKLVTFYSKLPIRISYKAFLNLENFLTYQNLDKFCVIKKRDDLILVDPENLKLLQKEKIKFTTPINQKNNYVSFISCYTLWVYKINEKEVNNYFLSKLNHN